MAGGHFSIKAHLKRYIVYYRNILFVACRYLVAGLLVPPVLGFAAG